MATYKLKKYTKEVEQAINLLKSFGIVENEFSEKIDIQTNFVDNFDYNPHVSHRIISFSHKHRMFRHTRLDVNFFKSRKIILIENNNVINFNNIPKVIKNPDLYVSLLFDALTIQNFGLGVGLLILHGLYIVFSSCVSSLTRQELYVLLLINHNRNKSIEKEELLKRIQEDGMGADINLDCIIFNLKKHCLIESFDRNKYRK